MKNKSVSFFNSIMLLSVLLFITTNVVQASTDSLFVASGNLGGIGIRFEVDSVFTRIMYISPDMPAERSGQLKVGDRIVGVGQGESGEIIDIKGKSSEEVGGLIKGQVGTKVRLAILPADKNASDPPLIIELVREYLQRGINLSNVNTWYFKPGDNIAWAKPDHDDSDWYPISPGGLAIEEMPDSLWKGYGWWRLTFTADSSFYAENWTINYYGWGAAEVYLDGKLVHRFGNFSTDPEQEHTFSTIGQIYPPVQISENETHTIAVRYSYHQAKQYNFFMKEYAGYLGFGIGFGTHAMNKATAEIDTYRGFTLFVSGAILFVLLLLHFMLYYKFSGDRTNLFLSITFALLLISVLAINNPVYADVTRYWYIILEFIWAYSISFAILFLPYVIAEMFRMDSLKNVLWLVAGYPLIVITISFNSELTAYIALVLFTVSIIFVGYICWRAYREKRKGVHYVSLGALGSLSLVIVYLLNFTDYIQLDIRSYYVMIAFIYTLFPLGLTLYIADRYGYLFTSLEREVGERTNELQKSYNKLEESLSNLKAAQTQLIQQEKLASLGQLTAGIAHEIKNPLNFVNNFSELSVELIEEAREEVRRVTDERGPEGSPLEGSGEAERSRGVSDSGQDPDLLLDLLDDIEANLQTIHKHGSRADSIVKSMLQHSRGGDGTMEPTPINPLIREYVNLAFHGMRAGKNPINVDIDLQLDESVGEVPLVAEDFSRVVLNLVNNAFDAMRTLSAERSAHGERQGSGRKVQGTGEYEPKLTVRTKSSDATITIEVEDNGPGIPEEMKDKILQPFFTTKKGTEGTGLGLSITNDIIKAHGGDLEIRSEPNEGTTFIIKLTK